MKCISIWQPYATLLVMGYKTFETRTWPAPKYIIGQRIGIAATKCLNATQKAHFEEEAFQEFYSRLALPDLIDLPRGMLLGTVFVDSVELITEDLLEDVSEEEKEYGWWEEGFYGWRMTDPVVFDEPLLISGKQGIYDYRGRLPHAPDEGRKASDQTRPADIRGNLRTV